MHIEAYTWLRDVLQRIGHQPSVVEFGARNINGSVRGLMHSVTTYVGVDVQPGQFVDVVGDAADYIPTETPDLVVSAETLEHAARAREIVLNALAIVKPGGHVVLTCAGPERPTHSGVDGGPTLHPGEWYQGLSEQQIVGWVAEGGGDVVEAQSHPQRGDVYVWAQRHASATPILRDSRSRTPPTHLRVLLVHPGASWSTADVYDGLLYGLRQQEGVHVDTYRLDTRIQASIKALHWLWRMKKKDQPDLPKPTTVDVMYHAGIGALEMALRQQSHVVLIVSAMLQHPDTILMMKRAGLRVVVLFTETPYDIDYELRIAKLVDGCWTNERSCVETFKAVNPRSGYLPHAWHPLKHFVSTASSDVPSHDVVFVGSGFAERVAWFNSIDWSGIDLGLYGTWKKLGLNKQLQACVKGGQISNEMSASLYRQAKIGLNLYRTHKGWNFKRIDSPRVSRAESLSPRAYELAACGSFHLSANRAEVREVFGDLVPTFSSPTEAAALIRLWLHDDQGRARVAAQLPACVAEASWVARAQTVLGDLYRLFHQTQAA